MDLLGWIFWGGSVSINLLILICWHQFADIDLLALIYQPKLNSVNLMV